MRINKLRAILISTLLVSACADYYVDEEENAADLRFRAKTDQKSLSPEMNLKLQANYSRLLSGAYVDAGRQAQQGQDVAAVITFLAAGAFVSGAVGSASDTALANIAIAGAGSTAVATRTVSKTVIEGIYLAARRMNCVSTVADGGRYILADTSPNTKGYARAATYGAIKEVQILVRLALAREVADFGELKTSLTDAVDPSKIRDLAKAEKENEGDKKAVDFILLNRYLKLLDGCLADAATLKPVSEVDTSGD